MSFLVIMRTKFLFIIGILFTINNLFADNYNQQIQNLQKQLDELSKKIELQEKQRNKNYNILDGLSFNGRLHTGATWYNENDELKEYNNNSFNNNATVKRARLNVKKQINDFSLNLEINYQKNRISLGDAYIGYSINDKNFFKIGQSMIPAFMEREKSTNTMATITFNAPESLGWVAGYLIGVDYVYYGNRSGLSMGVFGNGTNNDSQLENDMNYNFSFRNFYTPIKNKNWLLHLGYDFMYQDYNESVRYNPTKIDYSYFYGLEFALQYKFMDISSEFIKMYRKYEKDSRFGKANFDFDGFSTEFVVNFTGEKRNYSQKGGYIAGVKVKNPVSKGGYGAWQGVLRYSFADGKDTNKGIINNIGCQYDYTVGISWIPENYIMILFNYSKNGITKTNNVGNYTAKGKYDAFAIEARMFF